MALDADAREIIETANLSIALIHRNYGADVSEEHAALTAQVTIAQSNLAIAAAILELAEAVRKRE